jgi:hypothetical protein
MSTFKMELEYKLELGGFILSRQVLQRLHDMVVEHCRGAIRSLRQSRQIDYYDTPDFALAHQGSTIRRVSGFNPPRDGQAQYRYDAKVGPVNTPERLEDGRWLDNNLSATEIADLLELHGRLPGLTGPVIETRTVHHKMHFAYEGAQIESSLDVFRLPTGRKVLLRELEFELISGSPEALEAFMLVVRQPDKFPADQFSLFPPNKNTRSWHACSATCNLCPCLSGIFSFIQLVLSH